MRRIFLQLFFLAPLCLQASDELVVGDHLVHIVSPFETIDYLTTFSHSGEVVWEIPFSSQVVSWEVKGSSLFVFSKTRNGQIYFLSCLNAETGELVWEKSIFSPIVSDL